MTNIEELSDLGMPIYDNYQILKHDDDKWDSILRNCHPMCEQIQTLAASLIYRIDLISQPDNITSIEVTEDDYDTILNMWSQTAVFEVQLARLGEDFIEDNMETVNRALEGMTDYFAAGAAEMEVVTRMLLFEDPGVAEDAEDMFETYFDIAYYAFLVPAILMTIILAVYLVGYFLGLLSKVGSVNRKKHAASLMYSGTMLFFIFSFVFWLLTTLLFVSGTAIQKLYCDTLEEPEDSELYVMFEDEVNEALLKAFNNTGFEDTTWDVPRMLEECEQGRSLYEILHLDDAFDVRTLRSWRSYVDVKAIEQDLILSLGNTVNDVVTYLVFEDYDNTRADMLALQDRLLPIIDDYIDDYMDHYFDDVVRYTTMANLSDALGALNELTDDDTVQDNLVYFLDLLGEMLDGMPAFEEKYYEVKAHAEAYDVEVTYTTISVFEVIDDVFDVWYPVSQDQLLNNWQDILGEELIEDYEDSVALFDWFAEYSSIYLGEDLGECTHMFGIYEAAINYSCRELVDPLNSVWSGMGLILVCFIPMLLCAMKIEGIFRAEKPDLTEVADVWAHEHPLEPIQEKAGEEQDQDSMEKAPVNFSSSSSSDNSMSKEMEEVKPL